jgi:hypothetical protein
MERVLRYRGDRRQDHDGENQRRRQKPGTAKGGAEERDPAEGFIEPISNRPDRGDHNKDAPQAKHHAWDCRQHIDDRAKHQRDTERQKVLRQKNSDGEPEEAADEQGEKRAIESAPDLGKNPKLLICYVPVGRGQKTEVIVIDRRQCQAADFPKDVANQQNYQRSSTYREKPKAPIDEVFVRRRWMSDRTGRGRTFKRVGRHKSISQFSGGSAHQQSAAAYWICADAVLIFSITFAGNGMYPMLSESF